MYARRFRNRGRNLDIWLDIVDTPFGKAIIAETNKGISAIEFDGNREAVVRRFQNASVKTGLGVNGNKVEHYFKTWQIPDKPIGLDLIGSSFQVQVWKALLKVPTSHFASYKDIATLIKNPEAVRAVGTAIGKNPIAYLIPCHRVIKSGGEFGNYKWNPIRKEIINGYEIAKLQYGQ